MGNHIMNTERFEAFFIKKNKKTGQKKRQKPTCKNLDILEFGIIVLVKRKKQA